MLEEFVRMLYKVSKGNISTTACYETYYLDIQDRDGGSAQFLLTKEEFDLANEVIKELNK